jgi:hypothetical protein
VAVCLLAVSAVAGTAAQAAPAGKIAGLSYEQAAAAGVLVGVTGIILFVNGDDDDAAVVLPSQPQPPQPPPTTTTTTTTTSTAG